MSNRDKETLRKITQAFKDLPPEKREYLIGYAEGVAAMSEAKPPEKDQKNPAS
mgnify:FL=1